MRTTLEWVKDRHLPEGTIYLDRGCTYCPKALSCTLPICALEMPAGRRSAITLERRKRARELRKTMTMRATARTLGVTIRTVQRLLNG